MMHPELAETLPALVVTVNLTPWLVSTGGVLFLVLVKIAHWTLRIDRKVDLLVAYLASAGVIERDAAGELRGRKLAARELVD